MFSFAILVAADSTATRYVPMKPIVSLICARSLHVRHTSAALKCEDLKHECLLETMAEDGILRLPLVAAACLLV